MNKGYDNAALFYDPLSKLVFGNKLQQAQSAFLHLIPQDARILIVGGGSGWVLEEIARIHPNNKLSITYVEASPKMTALAQQRIKKSAGLDNAPFFINFITAPIEEAQLDDNYNVIITSFLFDNFKQQQAEATFRRLDAVLKPNGIWLYTDFTNNTNTTHKLVLKAMYLFFGILCGVPAKSLPDMNRLFDNYKQCERKSWMNGFVESHAYIKSIT